MTIDWGFITGLEAEKLDGYVPKAGDSGVTIGAGVDLGQRSAGELSMGLPLALADRLRPYLGLHGAAAVAALQAKPLHVSKEEAAQLDNWARGLITDPLARHYQTTAGFPFSSLPSAAQTVIASVSYQYGATWARCPRFWAKACERDWPAVSHELRNFGDDYPTRRKHEADYLDQHIDGAMV